MHDSDSMEVDEHVRFFNNDLKSTKEVMEEALSYAKFKYERILQCARFCYNYLLPTRYLFEGLGYLIASILISSTNFLGAINDYGIKRMYEDKSRRRFFPLFTYFPGATIFTICSKISPTSQ